MLVEDPEAAASKLPPEEVVIVLLSCCQCLLLQGLHCQLLVVPDQSLMGIAVIDTNSGT